MKNHGRETDDVLCTPIFFYRNRRDLDFLSHYLAFPLLKKNRRRKAGTLKFLTVFLPKNIWKKDEKNKNCRHRVSKTQVSILI